MKIFELASESHYYPSSTCSYRAVKIYKGPDGMELVLFFCKDAWVIVTLTKDKGENTFVDYAFDDLKKVKSLPRILGIKVCQ